MFGLCGCAYQYLCSNTRVDNNLMNYHGYQGASKATVLSG